MKFSQNRHIAQRHRYYRARILEFASQTPSARASLLDYQQWKASPEGQADTLRLRRLMQETNEELGVQFPLPNPESEK